MPTHELPHTPLIIYLDTQDYIKLFNESGKGSNHKVLADLLAYRDRGEIVIGFSFATIMEFITKPDDANRGERVRRGELIKSICGRNAFPSPTAISKGASFPNDGMWLFSAGEKAISAQQFRKQMHATLSQELAEVKNLNRSQRRKLSRKTSIQELIRKTESTWGRKRSDWGDIPVSEELLRSRIVERFVKGQCTDREFEEQINAWFFDPAEYSRIVYDYADQPNIVDKYFGKSIDKIEHLVDTVQGVISHIQQANEQVLEVRAELVDAGIRKSSARKLTKQVPIPELNSKTIGSKLEASIGKGRVEHFRHYIAHAMRPSYNFRKSDIMDLFHMCYAYDCDLFRCDKSMANTFRDFEPFQGKLVDRFADLPERIDTLLGCK